MTSSFCKLKPLSLAVFLGLAACGGGGGSSTTSPTAGPEVSGVVEAPQGQIAQFEHDQSTLVALAELIFPGAFAAISGLQPVTGATVELIRVDNSGAQIGDVLATASTSITGNYSLSLPAGVDFSGDLVLRITGNGGASMSAQVVEQSVDINPVSEYILKKFIASGTALNNLAVNEVVALTGRIEQFDLTASSDITTMLAKLDAEVGQFVENEITVITAAPGNGAAAVGNWDLVGIRLGFHDSDGQGSGTFAVDINTQALQVSDAGNGSINITMGQEDGARTNYSAPGMTLFYETTTDAGGTTITGNLDSNGNLSISMPFEEQLDTNSNPMYGWRWAPGLILATDTGSGNAKLAFIKQPGVRYRTTDTNGDGVNDAIDPAARDGDEVQLEMVFMLKEGSMSNTSLSGDYGLVNLQFNLNAAGSTTPGSTTTSSTVGTITFDGAGNASYAGGALNTTDVTRTTASTIKMTATNNSDPTPVNTTYTVASTGAVSIPVFGFQGQASADGMVVVGVSSASTANGANPAIIDVVDSDINVLTRLGTGVTAAALANTSYRMQGMMLNGDNSGYQSLNLLSKASSVSFDASGANITINAIDNGIERSGDTAEIIAMPATTPFTLTLPVSIGSKGEISISTVNGNETINIDGYLSADTNMLVLRMVSQDSTTGNINTALLTGIKQ